MSLLEQLRPVLDDEDNCLAGRKSLYIRTYLVRAGLLARGMLLHGRVIAFNKMVADAKKGKKIKAIHPAMPSSEVQFWLMSDTTRHLESWFPIIFFELLSGLPVKSVEAVTYVVDPRSVIAAYHKFVQHDPTHRVYRITLANKQVWVLDPAGARLGYDEMLWPWENFKMRSKDAKSITPIKPDMAKFASLMGMCHHPGPGARSKDNGGKGDNFVEEETLERRALRMWATCWTDLLPEVFGGSMANLGFMGHEAFSVAVDEFLAVFEAYVKTYLLDTDYYGILVRDQAACLPWAGKMYDAHPEGGHEDEHDHGCCEHCNCDCHGDEEEEDEDPGCYHSALYQTMRRIERSGETRWDIRTLIEDVTGKGAEELSKQELLTVVQTIMIQRAGSRAQEMR